MVYMYHSFLIHVNVRQKPLQYCKAISLQLIKTKTPYFYNHSHLRHEIQFIKAKQITSVKFLRFIIAS